jgi:hypothetical protein
MARYKATVIIDVHEDEDKEEGLIGNITGYVKELGDLLAEQMIKSFYDDIKERTGNKDEEFKATYKIISFEKLLESD